MKLFIHLFKSLFIAVLFCLLLEHFGVVTFYRDFKLERFLDKHLFVHMTTENIDTVEKSFESASFFCIKAIWRPPSENI